MYSESVTTHRPNPLTGGRDAFVVSTVDRHGAPLRNVCWKDTGFIGVDPIPISDVETFYKKEYRQEYKGAVSPHGRHVLRASRVALSRFGRIREFFPAIADKKLSTLDAGASSGEFVFLMKKLGHKASGVEAHEGYAAHSKQVLGLDVTSGVFSEFKVEGKRFDLISMFHVLEHLEFPVPELARLATCLSEEGVFVIEVPNILYQGMRFAHKWHRGHLSGFSARTLEATALRAGLHPLMCGEIGDGGNLFGVFRKGNPLSEDAIIQRLGGAEPEISRLTANSDADYFGRSSTWLKLGPKLFSQLEERRTAQSFKTPVDILEAVYSGKA
jgi:2-polyprenyl-3-methyl-5-hydroxy-6-metoxy-1,4-benzoquinol methylase